MSGFDTPMPTNPDALDPAAIPRKLLEKVKKREKIFEDGWWKDAQIATDIYNNEKDDPANPYNILYSNTEVLKPSLYSATPKPDVRGRFVENPVSPLTKMVENFLIIFTDPADPGEESFDAAMSDAVTSSLVSGLGFIRLHAYDDKAFPLCPESGHYKGLIWADGKKWSKLPWIAFRHELTKAEIFQKFSIPEAKQADYTAPVEPDGENQGEKRYSSIVYEVWVKETREIHYLCEDYKDIELQAPEKDTMKLQGFYPTPGPLLMTIKANRLRPTPLYNYYKNQAEELNRVTARLNKVLSAIRVKGAYNALLGKDLEKMLNSDETENSLVAASEAGLMLQNGGFDKQIWLLPIERLVEVATQLYQARMQIKQVIYEITGLSDIIRGASVASETATAQNLKNKWGSIRLRDMQKSVAGYVRDMYRLATDAGVEIIPAAKWKEITQSKLPTAKEKEELGIYVQNMLAQAQAAMQQAQMTGQQPPQIPPPDPAMLATLKSPTIEETLDRIKNDANRAYTINVQSDSTVDIDTATDKAEVTEYMNSMGQLMAGLQPLAALGPTGMEAGKAILIAVSSRFKFGLSILDALRALQAPPPEAKGPTPEQEKAQKDLDAKAAELEKKEDALKDMLDQIEDQKRELEVLRKEIQADIKVAKAEMGAQSAQESAQHVQRESKLKETIIKATTPKPQPGNRAGSGSGAGKPAPATAPKADPGTSAAIQALSETVQEMQKALARLNGPRIARKDPATGDWYSVPVPAPTTVQ